MRGPGIEDEEGNQEVWALLADDCNLSAAAGSGIGVIVSKGDAGGYLGRGAGALYVWDQDSLGIGVRVVSCESSSLQKLSDRPWQRRRQYRKPRRKDKI